MLSLFNKVFLGGDLNDAKKNCRRKSLIYTTAKFYSHLLLNQLSDNQYGFQQGKFYDRQSYLVFIQ